MACHSSACCLLCSYSDGDSEELDEQEVLALLVDR